MFSVPVAPHVHHPGDGRLPGEASRRRQRALHSAADAGLPGTQVPSLCSHQAEACEIRFLTPLLGLRSPPSSSWTPGWLACWASTLRPAPASSRPSGSTSKPTSCRTPTTRSTSTVTSTSSRYVGKHPSAAAGISGWRRAGAPSHPSVEHRVSGESTSAFTCSSRVDFRLPSAEVLRDPSASHQPPPAPGPHRHQPHHQVHAPPAPPNLKSTSPRTSFIDT